MRDYAPSAAQPVAYALQRLYKPLPSRLHARFQRVNLFIQLRHEGSDARDHMLCLHLVEQREGGVLHTQRGALGSKLPLYSWLDGQHRTLGVFNNKPGTRLQRMDNTDAAGVGLMSTCKGPLKTTGANVHCPILAYTTWCIYTLAWERTASSGLSAAHVSNGECDSISAAVVYRGCLLVAWHNLTCPAGGQMHFDSARDDKVRPRACRQSLLREHRRQPARPEDSSSSLTKHARDNIACAVENLNE